MRQIYLGRGVVLQRCFHPEGLLSSSGSSACSAAGGTELEILSQFIPAGNLPSPLGKRLQRLVWGNEFCTFTECEIPQGHSCTRKEKSNPALSFWVLAVKKVNRIQFSGFCLRPGRAWGQEQQSPSDITLTTLTRKLGILGACVAGVYTQGGATNAPKPPRRSSKPRYLPRNLGDAARCLLSDATVCNAVLGVEACGAAPRPGRRACAGCPLPRPAAGSFSPDVRGGDGGGARGVKTLWQIAPAI